MRMRACLCVCGGGQVNSEGLSESKDQQQNWKDEASTEQRADGLPLWHRVLQ